MPVIESLKITLADMQRNHNNTVIQLVFLRHVSKWKDCDSGGSKLCLSGREKVSGNESAPTITQTSTHSLHFHSMAFSSTKLNFIMRD